MYIYIYISIYKYIYMYTYHIYIYIYIYIYVHVSIFYTYVYLYIYSENVHTTVHNLHSHVVIPLHSLRLPHPDSLLCQFNDVKTWHLRKRVSF